MNSTELLATFRDEMSDAEAPYLWSDSLVYRYMDDAQKMFCRKTEGIEDSRTASVCRISVVSATEWYALSPLVLKVRKVRRNDTGQPVPVYNIEKADQYQIRFDGRVGPVKALIAGMERNMLRAYPVPNETVNLNLSVFRLPLEDIEGTGQDLEIDPQHHLGLLLWMKHKAYDKQDAETFDRRKSDDFEQKFYKYCAAAKVEQERARREVGNVAYGGI